MSSSEEDYKSSSSNEVISSDKPVPAAISRGRGAIPRHLSNRRLSTKQQDDNSDNSDSTDIKQPRSNPKRYTTEDIDREIAMYKEQSSSDSSSSDSSSDDDVPTAAKSKKKAKPNIKLSINKKKKKPVRKKLGYKTQQAAATTTKKKKQPAKKNKKKAPISKNKKAYGMKDDFVVNSDDDSEEEEEEMLSSSDDASSKEESGEEWDANDSDARASSDEDSIDGDDDDSDSDFGAPKRKKGSAKKKKKKKASTTRGKAKKKSTPAKSTRRTTRKTYQEESSSSEAEEEEIQYDTTPSGKRRPRRQCKTETEEKMHKYVQSDMQSEREALGNMLEDDDKELLDKSDASDNENSSDDESVVQTKKKNTKKKKAAASPKMKNKYDEDEDYNEDDVPSDTNNSSGDEDMSDYEEESDEDEAPTKRRRKSSRKTTKQRSSTRTKQTKTTSYKDIDESDIGTADEDSDDEETGPSMLLSPARNNKSAYGTASGSSSPRGARARMGRSPLDMHEDESDSDSIGGKKKKPKKKRRKIGSDESDSSAESSSDDDLMDKKKKHTKLKSTHINCPSTIDDITMANLPKGKPHVCYIAPDGKTRHCFALDTLYRIAISSKSNDNEPNIISLLDSGSKPRLQFLQPPHFRSPMEDDLLDQIASRFGRGALVIEQSNVYKRMKGIAINTEEWDEFDSGNVKHFLDGGLGEGTNFQARFERYIQNQMGSQDIYCCPLCFNEADRRMGNDDEEFEADDLSDDGKGDEQKDRFRYSDDPLTILGRLDDEQFQIASTFCFRRLADVKTHLKVVHGCDTKEIAGNDLYKRFQIRTGDGLLQSWLKVTLRRQTVQGDMMRYWNEGQNQSFVLLLSQIDKGRAIGEHSGEYGSDFSFSFPNRAKKIWRDVSAPFLKLSGEDMNDFIAGDDESEEEGDALPFNPNFTPPDMNGDKFLSPEEQMISTLKMKNRRRRSHLGSDASSDSDSSSELEVLPKPQEYEEEEEEEDMWEKGKSIATAKKRKARKRKSFKSAGDSDESSEDEDVFDSDADKKPAAKNGSARKVILDDEDESDSDSDGDSMLPSFRKKNKKSAHTLNFSDDEVVPIPKKPKPVAKTGSAKKRIKEDSSDEESL